MVRSELEAELLCGLLRTGGVKCTRHDVRSVEEVSAFEIIVASDDLDEARALLATVET